MRKHIIDHIAKQKRKRKGRLVRYIDTHNILTSEGRFKQEWIVMSEQKDSLLIGVLALQGAFEEHQAALEAVGGCRTKQVCTYIDISESTTRPTGDGSLSFRLLSY